MTTNFSETPPLELVMLIISLVATARKDHAAWFGEEEHESSAEIVMMHTDISRTYFHASRKKENHVELPPEMWSTLWNSRVRTAERVVGGSNEVGHAGTHGDVQVLEHVCHFFNTSALPHGQTDAFSRHIHLPAWHVGAKTSLLHMALELYWRHRQPFMERLGGRRRWERDVRNMATSNEARGWEKRWEEEGRNRATLNEARP